MADRLGGLPALARPLLSDLAALATGRNGRGGVGPLNIDDVRARARKRSCALPFSYVDSAAEDFATHRANLRAFDEVTLRPDLLTDVRDRDRSITLFGRTLASPVLLAPTGMPGIQHADAEFAGAGAAHAAGTVFTVSMASSHSVTRIAERCPGPLWFQLYPWGNADDFTPYVELAARAGCEALVVTLDTPVGGNREADIRTGFTMPPRLSRANAGEVLRHPVRFGRWIRTLAAGPGIAMGNIAETGVTGGMNAVHQATKFEAKFVPGFSAAELALVRRLWDGPLLVKGITTAEQARRARAAGVDGVIVSNHGGRQLDGLPASLRALPEVAEALDGTGTEILLDGGIRRGTDVLKALALGARAVMIGRPWVWGLAAAGRPGVDTVLRILHTEIERDMALMGVRTLADLGPRHVNVPAAWAYAAPREASTTLAP
ncbi:alpha-hydroxy acid oxidase [Yinghuangia soli]|uniref:Alpha-hydroxy-acid oxidizing protein n=1 Tax=Yinghuangia soli TaxID=2908204 RepID=A0AA41PZK5_9ACTN|nr:alpha-hydroxy acid oxidase [Yinghuangia soli]MCF2528723.1 alpha-hydroxy-acid oxidizing protein [Yinghuangia soli]